MTTKYRRATLADPGYIFHKRETEKVPVPDSSKPPPQPMPETIMEMRSAKDKTKKKKKGRSATMLSARLTQSINPMGKKYLGE